MSLFQNVGYAGNTRAKSAPTALVSIKPQSRSSISSNIACRAQSFRTWDLEKVVEVIKEIKARRVCHGSQEGASNVLHRAPKIFKRSSMQGLVKLLLDDVVQ